MEKLCHTALRRVLLTILLCTTAIQVKAVTINTTKSLYEPGGVRYYFVVNSWDSSASWSPCNTNDNRFTHCHISIIAKRPGSLANSAGDYITWVVPIRRDSTMGQLLLDLNGKGFKIPHEGSILVRNESANNNLCISFTYAQTGPDLGGAVNIWGPCARVIAPVLQCEINGDTIINHRNISDNEIDGAQASTQLNVACRGPTSVTVSASRTNSYGVRLRDDNSLYSKITVNGKDATTGINVPVNNDVASPLNITSTLVSRGTVPPGAFSGSTVITVSPP